MKDGFLLHHRAFEHCVDNSNKFAAFLVCLIAELMPLSQARCKVWGRVPLTLAVTTAILLGKWQHPLFPPSPFCFDGERSKTGCLCQCLFRLHFTFRSGIPAFSRNAALPSRCAEPDDDWSDGCYWNCRSTHQPCTFFVFQHLRRFFNSFLLLFLFANG